MAARPELGTFSIMQNLRREDEGPVSSCALRCANVITIGRPRGGGLASAWLLLPQGGRSSLQLQHRASVVDDGQPQPSSEMDPAPLRLSLELEVRRRRRRRRHRRRRAFTGCLARLRPVECVRFLCVCLLTFHAPRTTHHSQAIMLDASPAAGDPLEEILTVPVKPGVRNGGLRLPWLGLTLPVPPPPPPPPPPLPLPLPVPPDLRAAVEDAGTFTVTHLDDDLRITRGEDGAVRVFISAPPLGD